MMLTHRPAYSRPLDPLHNFKIKVTVKKVRSGDLSNKKNKGKKKNKKAENTLISRFLNFTGYKKNKIIFKKTHGWKYSYNFKGSPFKSYWNKKLRLGLCADWFIGPKVENAWLSANDLAKKIK